MASIKMKELEAQAKSRKVSGDLLGALECRQELELIHDSIEADRNIRTQNLNQIANLAVHIGNQNEAERSARKSVGLSVDLPDENRATCLMLLACVLAEFGQFDEAVAFGEQAVELFEGVHGIGSDFVVYRKQDLKRMREKQVRKYLDL